MLLIRPYFCFRKAVNSLDMDFQARQLLRRVAQGSELEVEDILGQNRKAKPARY